MGSSKAADRSIGSWMRLLMSLPPQALLLVSCTSVDVTYLGVIDQRFQPGGSRPVEQSATAVSPAWEFDGIFELAPEDQGSLDATPHTTGTVLGHVIAADSTPVPYAVITFTLGEGSDGRTWAPFYANWQGEFQIRGLPFGVCTVTAIEQEAARREVTRIVLSEDQHQLSIEMRLPKTVEDQ